MKTVYRAFAFCLMIFLGSCSKTGSFRPEITIHLSADPATLDPSGFEDGHALKILSNIIDPLYENQKNGGVNPLSAIQTKLSANGKTYTFKIDPSQKWSNGDPVTAQDYAFGIERARDTKNGGRQSDALKSLDFIETPDATTIVFHLKEPCSFFLKVLTLPIAPLPKNWFEREKKWSVAMPTNGPFKLIYYEKGQRIDLEKNYFYSKKNRQPSLSKVRWQIIEDEQTASQLFRSNQIDILTRIPVFEIKKYEQEGLLKKDPFAATYFLGFNVKKTPANNLAFRQALTNAIDPAAIVRILESYDIPSSTWLPPGIEGHSFKAKNHYPVKKFNPAQHAEMSFDSSQKNQTIAEYVQAQALKVSGVELKLSPADWKTHLSKLSHGETAVFRFARQAPFSDPIMHLQAFTSLSPANKTGWSSKKYDALIQKVASEMNRERKEQWIHQALKILLDEERVIIPIYHYIQLHAVSKKVTGFSVDPFSVISLHELSTVKP